MDEEQAKLTLADYFDIHLDHAPKEGAELALDPIVLVARSIGGGRVNVVGLRLPEDEEEAAPLTRLARSSASWRRSGRRWRGSRLGAHQSNENPDDRFEPDLDQPAAGLLIAN